MANESNAKRSITQILFVTSLIALKRIPKRPNWTQTNAKKTYIYEAKQTESEVIANGLGKIVKQFESKQKKLIFDASLLTDCRWFMTY